VSNAGSSETPREVIARLNKEIADVRASRRRLAEASAAERRAIERELHDGVQQHLVALAVDFQRLVALIDRDGNAAQALLTEVRANLGEALDEATRLAKRIYPPIVGERGLAAAMRAAANDAGVRAVVDVPPVVDYPHQVTATLYWTWVDAIAGRRTGSESSIAVLAADGGLSFLLTIEARATAGGLDRLRDRIEALDGRLNFDDRHGRIARLQGWLPLPR
jgi:signal transduction histidine kinase